ncbi:DNA-binding protein H-NS [Vibrio sp. JCM 19053]|nr:DNA-binding protein H-NS [Vibrio sp. JCM 19053]
MFSRDLTLDQLEEAHSKLTTIVEERREEEEALRAEQAEKEAKLATIAKQIKEQGIDVNELVSALSSKKVKSKGKRQARSAKYKYVDDNGVEKKHGLVKVVRHLLSKKHLMVVKHWITLLFKYTHRFTAMVSVLMSLTSSSQIIELGLLELSILLYLEYDNI